MGSLLAVWLGVLKSSIVWDIFFSLVLVSETNPVSILLAFVLLYVNLIIRPAKEPRRREKFSSSTQQKFHYYLELGVDSKMLLNFCAVFLNSDYYPNFFPEIEY